LNNINLHIYQGESLGIIGEPGSSKSLIGRILSGEVKPDKGKVIRKMDVFYADIDDKYLQDISVVDYVSHVVTLFPYKIYTHKVLQNLKYAHIEKKRYTSIS